MKEREATIQKRENYITPTHTFERERERFYITYSFQEEKKKTYSFQWERQTDMLHTPLRKRERYIHTFQRERERERKREMLYMHFWERDLSYDTNKFQRLLWHHTFIFISSLVMDLISFKLIFGLCQEKRNKLLPKKPNNKNLILHPNNPYGSCSTK